MSVTYEDTSPAVVYTPEPITVVRDYPWAQGWTRRVTDEATFSNGTATTGVGPAARATLKFRGTSVSVFWTKGYSACSRALITVDGSTTNVPCAPGDWNLISYNALAFTSVALDPAVEHTIVVQLDPASIAANPDGPSDETRAWLTRIAVLDLDRFVVAAPPSTLAGRPAEPSSAPAPVIDSFRPVATSATASVPAQPIISPSSALVQRPTLQSISLRGSSPAQASAPIAPTSAASSISRTPPVVLTLWVSVGAGTVVFVLLVSAAAWVCCRRRRQRRRTFASKDADLGDVSDKPSLATNAWSAAASAPSLDSGPYLPSSAASIFTPSRRPTTSVSVHDLRSSNTFDAHSLATSNIAAPIAQPHRSFFIASGATRTSSGGEPWLTTEPQLSDDTQSTYAASWNLSTRMSNVLWGRRDGLERG